jgi:hypothetical protein
MNEKQTVVIKNENLTESEKYLKELCDRTFLSLWSYPSLYRNQKDAFGEGKELCDLLVVFGNDVIIFSDKRVTFPQTGDLKLDWSRWYRKAVKDSAKQAWGAERWIKTFPNKIFLDKECTKSFPIHLPNVKDMKIHIVVVSHQASERCIKEFGGGSGSMMLYSNIPLYDDSNPFMISDIDDSRTFVHVLDDISLDIVLKTNDTASDFIEYLNKKEIFFRSGTPFVVAGEEDLLAFYLQTIGADGRHGFSFDSKYTGLKLEEGYWESFQCNPSRIAQLLENESSYFWDILIEKFSLHVLNGTPIQHIQE